MLLSDLHLMTKPALSVTLYKWRACPLIVQVISWSFIWSLSKPSPAKSRAARQRGVDGICYFTLCLVVSCTVLSCHIPRHVTALSDLGNEGWHFLFLLHPSQQEFHNKSPRQYDWQHIVTRGHLLRDSQISSFHAKHTLLEINSFYPNKDVIEVPFWVMRNGD